MSSTPTNPPFSGASTSSTPSAPQNYYNQPPSQPPSPSESRFNLNDWLLMLAPMAITGLIGYFSSLIAVKSDIAENKKSISVMEKDISHISSEIVKAQEEIKEIGDIQKTNAVMEYRIKILENSISNKADRREKLDAIAK